MKLRLSRFLTAALLAAAVSAPAYSSSTHTLDSPSELKGGTIISSDRTYKLLNYKDYTYSLEKENKPFISGSEGDEALRFISAAGQNEVTLIFTNGKTQAFYEIDNLSFENLKRLKFSALSSGVIYSEGSQNVPSALTISGVKDADTSTNDVDFWDNSITGNCGGAINATNATVSIDANGGVFFDNNKAYAATVSDDSPDQGGSIGGGASVAQNYTISLFGIDLNFEFGFGFGFTYKPDDPKTPEVEPSIDICGGAINLVDSTLTMNKNESVIFEKNSAVDYGGAISASPGIWSSVSINENAGQISFSDNSTTGHIQDGNVIGGGGGAIFIGKQASLQMNENTGDIKFKQNLAAAAGGAIYHGGQNLQYQDNSLEWIKNDGDISFVGNVAIGTGGAIHMMGGGRLEMSDNKGGIIKFESNKAGINGGAISALNAFVTLNDNSEIIFSDNLVFHQDIHSDETDSFVNRHVGGAIYGTDIQIHNNGSVLFERNAEIADDNSFRLRSLYVEGSYLDDKYLEGNPEAIKVSVSLSAGEGHSIEFRDSIYIKGAQLNLNASYADTPQTGDIIFTGATTEKDLKIVKQAWWTYANDENVSPDKVDAKEIENSRTSIVKDGTYLYGGKLRVEHGAIFKSCGIFLSPDSTLQIQDARIVNIDKDENISSETAIHVGEGATLKTLGHSTIQGGQLIFANGANWSFVLDDSHQDYLNNSAALTFDGLLNIEGGLNISLDLSGSDMGHTYELYRGTDASYDNIKALWTAGNITVTGTGDAAGATFDDLVWTDNSLRYKSSMEWSNNAGTGVWNLDHENWLNDKTFAHGMAVKFTDTAFDNTDFTGTVTLTDELSPGSVTVTNSQGNDYTFTSAPNDDEVVGKLTYRVDLEKRGAGALTLDMANDYEGTTKLEEGTLNLHDDNALGNSALSTAVGTTLGVDDGADVVLKDIKDKEHVIMGAVNVAAGSSLEIASGSYASPFSTVNGELIFNGQKAVVNAGSLSGAGLLEVTNGASATFRDASGFRGDVRVTGSSSSLFLKVVDSLQKAGELAVNAGDLTLRVTDQLTMAGGSVLSMVAGTVAEKVTTVLADKVIEFAGNAILSAMLGNMLGDLEDPDLLNEGVGGIVGGAGITLNAGSILELENCHIGMHSGNAEAATLTLNVTKEDTEKIKLVLLLDDFLSEDSKVLLFAGADKVNFVYDGASISDKGYHEYYAKDYFTGDMIGADTMLVYDGNERTVYLKGLVPEPTTATLSLLALAAAATRRRRK